MKPGDLVQKPNGNYWFKTTMGVQEISADYIENFLRGAYVPKYAHHYSYYRQLQDMKSRELSADLIEEGWLPVKNDDIDAAYETLTEMQRKLRFLDPKIAWRTPYISAEPEGEVGCSWRVGKDKKVRELHIHLSCDEKWYCILWGVWDGTTSVATRSGDLTIEKFYELWLWLYKLAPVV